MSADICVVHDNLGGRTEQLDIIAGFLATSLALQVKGSVKEPNKFHIYETEKITRKASDTAKYIQLFSSFTRDRHA